jgi:4'-phosphopantetheinyl transferase
MSDDLIWGPPPAGAIALPADEVHVWSAMLPLPEREMARCGAVLSADERSRAALPRTAEDQGRFVAVRGLLRLILGRYLPGGAEELRFSYGEHGKPALATEEAGLCFNVSHAGDAALFALSAGRDVGVDLELVRDVPRAERIAARVFAAEEMGRWLALSPELRRDAFLRQWTRLEAVAKLRGDGVWRTVIRRAHLDPGAACPVDLAPFPGYVGAVAVEGDARVVRFVWSYQD